MRKLDRFKQTLPDEVVISYIETGACCCCPCEAFCDVDKSSNCRDVLTKWGDEEVGPELTEEQKLIVHIYGRSDHCAEAGIAACPLWDIPNSCTTGGAYYAENCKESIKKYFYELNTKTE